MRILNSTGIYNAPNGDTSGRDGAQALRTGMGVDVDNLMMDTNVMCDVFTVEEGVKVKEPVFLDYKMKDGEGSLSAQVIHVKKNAEADIIMNYESPREAAGFLGISTRILAEEGSKVNAYPNPTISVVYVEADGMSHVEVYDNEGRRLQDYDASNTSKITVDMRPYTSGIYFIRVHMPKEVVIQKIIKQR